MRKRSLPIVLDDLNKFEGNIIVSLKSNDYDTLNSIKNLKFKFMNKMVMVMVML